MVIAFVQRQGLGPCFQVSLWAPGGQGGVTQNASAYQVFATPDGNIIRE